MPVQPFGRLVAGGNVTAEVPEKPLFVNVHEYWRVARFWEGFVASVTTKVHEAVHVQLLVICPGQPGPANP